MPKPVTAVPVLDRARSYMHIADALRHAIHRMNVPQGARLPSERDLARQLQISRPSLREALIVLELQGEIEIRVGSGIYLTRDALRLEPLARDSAAADVASEASLMGYSPREVNQTRFFLESGVAAHAARFITRKQLKALSASMDAMREALDMRGHAGDQPLADADRQFHTTLASITDNRLLIQTIEELFDQRYTPIGGSMHRLFDNQAVWQSAVDEHQAVYEAVADHDPLQAQAAMQRHLTCAHARLMAIIGPR